MQQAMINIVIDPDSRSLQPRFAIIAIPAQHRRRKRFAEGCVTLVESADAARAQADPAQNRYAAVVYGPSVSSEGQRLYYWVEWLSADIEK